MIFSRARSQALGAELRRRREQAGLSSRQLAHILNWSKTKVSNMETGTRTVAKIDAARFLAACRADGAETAELLDFFRDHDGYWIEPHDVRLSDELINLVSLEATARVVRHFELSVVPGLLQTEDYIRALLTSAGLVKEADVDVLVKARKDRQVVLRRQSPPQCSFFIHEHALRMEVGSAALMNDQLLHLMFLADRPHIEIRVVPAAMGPHPGLAGPFQLMGYDSQPPIVYLENEVASLFLDTGDVIGRYERMLGGLETAALDAGQSRRWLAELAGEYDRPRGETHDHGRDTTLAKE
jgi:transcriptional regulator with XRE-family HTH domain